MKLFRLHVVELAEFFLQAKHFAQLRYKVVDYLPMVAEVLYNYMEEEKVVAVALLVPIPIAMNLYHNLPSPFAPDFREEYIAAENFLLFPAQYLLQLNYFLMKAQNDRWIPHTYKKESQSTLLR